MVRSLVLCILLTALPALPCGGGVIPYVPSNFGGGSAAGMSASQKQGTFYLSIDKSVAGDALDIRQYQPLFKNVHHAGNERDHMEKLSVKKSTTDTSGTREKTRVSAPALNLNRIK